MLNTGDAALLGADTTAADRFPVLGIPVNAVQIPEVIGQMCRWIDAGEKGRTIAVTGMHGVTESLADPETRRAIAGSDMVVPDGMPLVWLGRWHGHGLRRRVYGPELMTAFCRATASRGYRHYFYGGGPGVAGRLAEALGGRFPGLQVAGTFSPPFRELEESELESVRSEINASGAHVVWVGLSTPKQEKWIQRNRSGLDASVLIGVGAAFDLNSGSLAQAPEWMRENGLEWLFRLGAEPRRLWRRYLLGGPRFVYNVGLELMRLKDY